MTAQLSHRQVEVDGLSIHVIEAGAGLSAPILCLHGWPQDASSFSALLADLGRDAHVPAMDLPEIGGSRGPPPAYDQRALAGCVRAVIDALDLEDVTLIGHDEGALVTYGYLRALPGELVRAPPAAPEVPERRGKPARGAARRLRVVPRVRRRRESQPQSGGPNDRDASALRSRRQRNRQDRGVGHGPA